MIISQMIRDVGIRIKASIAGHCRCRGIFRITDPDGNHLEGVDVYYRVGNSEWMPCGSSKFTYDDGGNFSQCSPVFYRIGEPVMWRFSKTGYAERTVTRYTADTDFDYALDTVVLLPASGF